MAWTIGPISFDPAVGGSCVVCNTTYLNAVYDRLIEVTTDFKLKPMLATSWELSPDGVLELRLREGVKFHDGTEFDAAAVKANLERTLRLPEASVVAKTIDSITEIEVRDSHTVVLHLDSPESEILYALGGLAGMMISPAAFDSNLSQMPVGAGPYRLVEATTGDSGSASYVRFEDYWDRTREVEPRLEIRGIPDDNQRINALLAGDVHAVNIKSATFDRGVSLAERDAYALTTYDTVSWLSIFLNSEKAPLDDREVRHALASAIDRSALSKVVSKGRCSPATQPLPPNMIGHDETITGPDFNPDMARQVLSAKNLSPLTMRFLVAGSAPWTDFATAIQAQLHEIGITAQLDVRPPSDSDQIWAQQAHEYHGYIAPKDASPSPGATFALTDRPFNPAGMPSAIAEVVDSARRATSEEEQQRLWAQASRMTVEEMQEVWICYPPFGYLHRSDVAGTEENPLGPFLSVDPSRWKFNRS